MSIMESIHRRFVYGRRVAVLTEELSRTIPPNTRVLDVGCGDGLIDSLILQRRPDMQIEGVDVLVRPKLHVPVKAFDGRRMPCENGSFDVVMFVDVLHHTDDPAVLLAEAARVARQAVVIKDHLLEGPMARATLLYMDRVGNEGYGVSLPFNYWPQYRWQQAFDSVGLKVQQWNTSFRLYPWWANWIFGRGMHFIARLGVADGCGAPAATTAGQEPSLLSRSFPRETGVVRVATLGYRPPPLS